jgi:hypothetical protein
MNIVEQQVESYLNGNVSSVKVWLKKANKIQVLDFVEELNNSGRDIHQALYETKRLLR